MSLNARADFPWAPSVFYADYPAEPPVSYGMRMTVLGLARMCSQPYAVWLGSVLPAGHVSTQVEISGGQAKPTVFRRTRSGSIIKVRTSSEDYALATEDADLAILADRDMALLESFMVARWKVEAPEVAVPPPADVDWWLEIYRNMTRGDPLEALCHLMQGRA